jgi:hypothetical protein
MKNKHIHTFGLYFKKKKKAWKDKSNLKEGVSMGYKETEEGMVLSQPPL